MVAIFSAVILNFSLSSAVFASQTFPFPDLTYTGQPVGFVTVNKTIFSPGETVHVSAHVTPGYYMFSSLSITRPKSARLASEDNCSFVNDLSPFVSSTPTSFSAPTVPGTYTMSFVLDTVYPQGWFGLVTSCMVFAPGGQYSSYLNINYRVATLPVVRFSSTDKTITLGQGVTYSASASDADAEMDYLALNWQNPNGTYNWTTPPSTGSYQATTNIGPYFHYARAKSAGSFAITMTPTTVGVYKIYAVAHDKIVNKWVRSPKTYTLTVKPQLPDLTAGVVTPTTATAGIAVTLRATIANNGNGSVRRGFTDLFQSASNSSGAGVTDIGTYSSVPLVAHTNNVAVLTHTFSSSNTTYVRVCADKNSSTNTGVITELNENNNCGAWTQISISGSSCTTPWGSVITSGSSVTAYKNSSITVPATCLSSFNSQKRICSDGSLSGSYTKESCTISLPVASPSSSPSASPSASPSQSSTAPALSGTLTIFPTMVKEGSSVPITLNWKVMGVKSLTTKQSCAINMGAGTSMKQVRQLMGSSPSIHVPISNSYTYNNNRKHIFNHQTVYTLSCGGNVLKTVLINLVPQYSSF